MTDRCCTHGDIGRGGGAVVAGAGAIAAGAGHPPGAGELGRAAQRLLQHSADGGVGLDVELTEVGAGGVPSEALAEASGANGVAVDDRTRRQGRIQACDSGIDVASQTSRDRLLREVFGSSSGLSGLGFGFIGARRDRRERDDEKDDDGVNDDQWY